MAILLACCAVLRSIAAQAAPGLSLQTVNNTNPLISIELADRSPGEQRLYVSGSWPSPCIPESATLTREGADIRVEARSHRGLCAKLSRPFRFELDTRKSLGEPLGKGLYRVSFFSANSASGPLELRGFKLLSVNEPTIQPEAGFWWPEHNAEHAQENAQGMSLTLETQGDVMAASLLTYNESGQPVWYFGTGRVDGRAAVIKLLGMHNGPGLFGGGGRTPEAEQSLDLKLEFLGGGRLSAWLGWYENGNAQPMMRLQSVTFARQSLGSPTGPTSWLGDWLLLRGEGLAASSQRVQLKENRRLDAERFQLVDPSGWSLTCHQTPALINSPPDSCVLAHSAGGEDIPFDNVGLSRLGGIDRAGQPISLIRPPH